MKFLLNNNIILSYILILIINIIPEDFDFLLTSYVKRDRRSLLISKLTPMDIVKSELFDRSIKLF